MTLTMNDRTRTFQDVASGLASPRSQGRIPLSLLVVPSPRTDKEVYSRGVRHIFQQDDAGNPGQGQGVEPFRARVGEVDEDY